MNERLRALQLTLSRRIAALPHREQIALGIAVAALGLGLLYVLLLAPSAAYLRSAQLRESQERELLAWMQQREPQVRALQAGAQAVPVNHDESLLTLASTTGKQAGLIFQRLEPGKDGRLTLWLSDTEFNALLDWLDGLVTGQRVVIERIALSQASRPGAVEAQIVLSRLSALSSIPP